MEVVKDFVANATTSALPQLRKKMEALKETVALAGSDLSALTVKKLVYKLCEVYSG